MARNHEIEAKSALSLIQALRRKSYIVRHKTLSGYETQSKRRRM